MYVYIYTYTHTQISFSGSSSDKESACNAGVKVRVKSVSHVRLFATPCTIGYQASLSMGFPGKGTGVGCYFLLQGIFPIQGSNLGLPHFRQILYCLNYQASPFIYGGVYVLIPLIILMN